MYHSLMCCYDYLQLIIVVFIASAFYNKKAFLLKGNFISPE